MCAPKNVPIIIGMYKYVRRRPETLKLCNRKNVPDINAYGCAHQKAVDKSVNNRRWLLIADVNKTVQTRFSLRDFGRLHIYM